MKKREGEITMRKAYNYIKKTYLYAINSIALTPLAIMALFFLLSLFMLYYETTDGSGDLRERLSFMLVKGAENARQVLSVIIGGMISLTVFSFSMVMVVVGQAANTLSPRLIPSILTQKNHQAVLGIYLGTIVFSLMLILNIHPQEELLPRLGILLSMIFGMLCLLLFIYFIHSISRSVQIDVILEKEFTKTINKLKEEGKRHNGNPETDKLPDTTDWYIIKSKENGYLRAINQKDLCEFGMKHDLIINITVPNGKFIVENEPIIKVSKDIRNNKEKVGFILDSLVIYSDEYIKEDYIYGIKHITEVAVKGLSPGINDTGTALAAIDYLGPLFIKWIQYDQPVQFKDAVDCVRVIQRQWSLGELIYNYLSMIRTYGRHDIHIVLRLFDLLQKLLYQEELTKNQSQAVYDYVDVIVEDADRDIKNQMDRAKINERIDIFNEMVEGKLKALKV